MKHLFALPVLLAISGPALADQPLQQGRSVGLCSDETLVCALMRDGHTIATDECRARREQAVRIVPGDCWDED